MFTFWCTELFFQWAVVSYKLQIKQWSRFHLPQGTNVKHLCDWNHRYRKTVGIKQAWLNLRASFLLVHGNSFKYIFIQVSLCQMLVFKWNQKNSSLKKYHSGVPPALLFLQKHSSLEICWLSVNMTFILKRVSSLTRTEQLLVLTYIGHDHNTFFICYW